MVSVIMLVYILTVLGVNTAAIIGSVSIVSIAIGMGTQDLVKDIVAGLFLVFESTISVGDIIEVGGWRGRVTDMGIRTTEVTNEHNDVKIVTNSSIANVVNYSKVKTLCAEEFEIPRMVEIKDLPVLVDAYIEAIVEDVPEVKDSLDLDEIMAISENSYTVRLSYKVNESERESVTIRLRNAMQLLLESGEVSLDDPASDEGAEEKDDE
jgi:small conductance mechanosensitive channel